MDTSFATKTTQITLAPTTDLTTIHLIGFSFSTGGVSTLHISEDTTALLLSLQALGPSRTRTVLGTAIIGALETAAWVGVVVSTTAM